MSRDDVCLRIETCAPGYCLTVILRNVKAHAPKTWVDWLTWRLGQGELRPAGSEEGYGCYWRDERANDAEDEAFCRLTPGLIDRIGRVDCHDHEAAFPHGCYTPYRPTANLAWLDLFVALCERSP